MAAADYRLMTEATGQRIAAALEALSGTGAAAAAARTNLDVYSKGETDNAIAQSTANVARLARKSTIAVGTSCTIAFLGRCAAIISVISSNGGKYATYIYEGYGPSSIRQTVTPLTPGNAYYTVVMNDDQSVTITPSEQISSTYDVGVLMVYGNPPTIT